MLTVEKHSQKNTTDKSIAAKPAPKTAEKTKKEYTTADTTTKTNKEY